MRICQSVEDTTYCYEAVVEAIARDYNALHADYSASIDDGLEVIGRDSAIDLLRRGDSNLWFDCDAATDDEFGFLQ